MSQRVHYDYSSRQRRIIWVVIFVLAAVVATGLFIYFSRTGEIVISADPAQAQIKFGEETVTGELAKNDLTPGRYLIEVSRAGFESVSEEIEIKRGQKIQRQIALAPQNFEFSLNSTPKKAEYKLILPDGSERKGQTPFKETVCAGEIKIELSADGFQTLSENYFLDQNRDLNLWLDQPGQLLHLLWQVPSGASPKGAAFRPNGEEIWVSLLMGKKAGANVFRASDGEKLQSINLKDNGGVEVIFNRAGDRAYVSQMETDTVYEIDVATREIIRSFPTKSTWCKILELSPDEQTLYVTNWSGNNISEIDLASGAVKRLIPTVATPRSVYVTRDGQYLYVAGFDKGELQRIKLDDLSSEVLYKSGGALRHIVADEDRQILYISDMAEAAIFRYHLDTGEMERWVKTDSNPNTIVLSPDKKVLFVSCRGTNADESYYVPGPDWGSVLVFDTASGEMLDAIVGGNQPTALALSADGTKLVSSNFLDGTLDLYAVPDYETLKNGNGGRSRQYKAELKK